MSTSWPADKGYHAAKQIELTEALNLRTYIPEPEREHRSRWTDKLPELKRAVYASFVGMPRRTSQ